MSGTCGPTCGTPFARYDPDSSSWRTSLDTSLWDLTLSSLTLPRWGCLHGGELSEHPTPELRTDAPASSSSGGGLPTPTARDSKGSDAPGRRGGPSLPAFVAMLPTPAVMDMGSSYTPEEWEAWRATQRAKHGNGNGHGDSLLQEALSMLPTPKAADGERGRDIARARPDERSRELATAVGLLPTPRAQNGKDRNQALYERPDGQPQNLENALARLPIGASTDPRSTDGSESSDEKHLLLPFPEPLDETA